MAYGLAYDISSLRPAQAKPKPMAFGPSQAWHNTSYQVYTGPAELAQYVRFPFS